MIILKTYREAEKEEGIIASNRRLIEIMERKISQVLAGIERCV